MAIGIGLHCWFCDHGPCSGECTREYNENMKKKSKSEKREKKIETILSNYSEVDGDLIELALNGKFDIITHGCNCLSKMGAGIAVGMASTFGCDKFPMELIGPDPKKLGNIDFKEFLLTPQGPFVSNQNPFNYKKLIVVNSYTQYKYGKNHKDGVEKPIDYEALTLCMRKINLEFAGKKIGLPKIGSGLAGGDWGKIKSIIQTELKDCEIVVVNYKKEISLYLS